MNSPIVLAVVSAAMYGTWPLVARFAPISPAWMSIILALATGAISTVALPGAATPSAKAVAIIAAAGVMNGIGMLAYSKIIGTNGVELSKVLPMIMVLMPVFTVIGSWIVFGDLMTAKKIAGVMMALAAVYLLA